MQWEKKKREKKRCRKRKPHKQQPSVRFKTLWAAGQTEYCRVEGWVECGIFSIFNFFLGGFQFYVGNVRSGVDNPCTIAAAVPGCNHDTQTNLDRSGSLIVPTAVHSWSHDTPSNQISLLDHGTIATTAQGIAMMLRSHVPVWLVYRNNRFPCGSLIWLLQSQSPRAISLVPPN